MNQDQMYQMMAQMAQPMDGMPQSQARPIPRPVQGNIQGQGNMLGATLGAALTQTGAYPQSGGYDQSRIYNHRPNQGQGNMQGQQRPNQGNMAALRQRWLAQQAQQNQGQGQDPRMAGNMIGAMGQGGYNPEQPMPGVPAMGGFQPTDRQMQRLQYLQSQGRMTGQNMGAMGQQRTMQKPSSPVGLMSKPPQGY